MKNIKQNQLITHSINQSISQYINQSINQSIDRSICPSIKQSINQIQVKKRKEKHLPSSSSCCSLSSIPCWFCCPSSLSSATVRKLNKVLLKTLFGNQACVDYALFVVSATGDRSKRSFVFTVVVNLAVGCDIN